MATMENQANDTKWEAIAKLVLGDKQARENLNTQRVNIRTIYGTKLMRELRYN